MRPIYFLSCTNRASTHQLGGVPQNGWFSFDGFDGFAGFWIGSGADLHLQRGAAEFWAEHLARSSAVAFVLWACDFCGISPQGREVFDRILWAG